MYFFDPQGGRRRRHVVGDRLAAVPRRLRRRFARKVGLVRARAGAMAAKGMHLRERRKDWSDETLADKVRSEVFRDPALPNPVPRSVSPCTMRMRSIGTPNTSTASCAYVVESPCPMPCVAENISM